MLLHVGSRHQDLQTVLPPPQFLLYSALPTGQSDDDINTSSFLLHTIPSTFLPPIRSQDSRGVMTDWSNKNVSTSNQNDALPGVIQERKNSSGYKSGVAACREHLSSGSLELSVQCWPINHDQGYRQTWGSKMLTFPVRRIKSYSAIRISFA